MTPNREIVSFRSCVRASERARDQRFDPVARAVVRAKYVRCCGKTMPGGLSAKNVVLMHGFSHFPRTTLVKPM